MRKQRWQRVLTVALVGAWLGVGGCAPEEFLAPGFFDLLGTGRRAAHLPGDAPAILIAVENRTTRYALIVVSYRDVNDSIETYTNIVAPQGRTAQLVPCPVMELTIGDVSNPAATGSRIYLVDDAFVAAGGDFTSAPFIDVEAFGVLLREDVNYACGDEVILTVQPSGVTRSGFQLFAYVRRAGA